MLKKQDTKSEVKMPVTKWEWDETPEKQPVKPNSTELTEEMEDLTIANTACNYCGATYPATVKVCPACKTYQS